MIYYNKDDIFVNAVGLNSCLTRKERAALVNQATVDSCFFSRI